MADALPAPQAPPRQRLRVRLTELATQAGAAHADQLADGLILLLEVHLAAK